MHCSYSCCRAKTTITFFAKITAFQWVNMDGEHTLQNTHMIHHQLVLSLATAVCLIDICCNEHRKSWTTNCNGGIWWGMSNIYPFQYPIRRIVIRSRKTSKARDREFKCSYRFQIWPAHRQHCCWGACPISEPSGNSEYNSWLRDFTRSYDKTSYRILKPGPACHDPEISRAPSQYKDRLIYVWRFPC